MKVSTPIRAMSRWIRKRVSSSLEDELNFCTISSLDNETLIKKFGAESLTTCDTAPLDTNDDDSIVSDTETVIHHSIIPEPTSHINSPGTQIKPTTCSNVFDNLFYSGLGLPVADISGSQEEIPLTLNSPDKTSSSINSWVETSTLVDSPIDSKPHTLYDVRLGLEEIPSKYEYIVALTNEIKTIEYNESFREIKIIDLSPSHIRDKVLRRKDKCYKMDYFQTIAARTRGNKKLEGFEVFNLKNFQIIRDLLGIHDNQFKGAFEQFYAKENDVYSTNGKFRLHRIGYEQAFFLHKNVEKAKAHLLKNRGTAIQQFIGLFRIGTKFFAIEYTDFDESKMYYLYNLMKSDEKKKLQYYMEEKGMDLHRPADRDSEIRRIFGIENRRPQKKMLLNDLKFLKRVNASDFKLAMGRKEE